MITPEVASLRGLDMLCFSHDWSGDPLSKTHLMRILARENRILWVNSIGYRTPTASASDLKRAWNKLKSFRSQPLREVEENIFVLNPLAVPIYGSRAAQAFNRRWLASQVRGAMRKLNFKGPTVNWVFNPAAGIIAGALDETSVIYYCVDEYTAFTGVDAERLGDLERRLMGRSDLVIVSAQPLLEAKAPFHPHTVLVRHGVDYDHFRKSLDPALELPEEVRNLPKPVIGFYGLIADWVDVELMAAAAKRWPQGTLVVLGKSTTDISALEALPNVKILGRKPYESLPAYSKAFDVSLLPFRLNTLTHAANPLKAREYLASGLPVISTPLPEVEVLEQCRIGAGEEGFLGQIEAALADPGPKEERSESVRHESWAARIDEIRGHLARVAAEPPRAAAG
jgi:glycosyltransferase involved in cell wall biosynthesis